MDFAPSKDAQQTTSLFSDNRAMRPDVPGTVARGQFVESLDMMTGIDMEALAAVDAPRAERLVAAFQAEAGADEASADSTGDAGGAQAATPSVMESTPWLEQNPLTVDRDFLAKGQQQYAIYCSVCHGMDGRGNGLVNQRAQSKGFDTWVPPASLHQQTLYTEQYPDGKLFSTISNGIRKMPGYASQIKLRDRWAIVAYVRALQQSQNASLDLVPEEQRPQLEKELKKAKAELEKQAQEAEKEAAKDETQTT
jgi:mono/diheme cytochrome c family protein